MELIPLAGEPEVFKSIFTMVAHQATIFGGNAFNTRVGGGLAARSFVRASASDVSPTNLAAWVAALRANPRQLGLYALLRWNTKLHVSAGQGGGQCQQSAQGHLPHY